MKVKVKQTFRDKDDFSKIYGVGDIVDFEDGRAANIIALGLADRADGGAKPDGGKADKPEGVQTAPDLDTLGGTTDDTPKRKRSKE